ncbi:MAG: DUF58 domain-containing protein [Pirellulales bacterium]
MARQRQIWLCREGLYYAAVFLAVLIGAVSRQLNLLMLLGCALSGPLLFSLVYGRLALRRLSVERKLPTHLYAGERLKVDVTVTNRRRWFGVWAIRVDDFVERDGAPAAEAAGVGVFFPRVSARETRQVNYDGRLPLRGLYRFGPLRVSTRFPLGLVRHSYELDDRAELLVHPKLGRLVHGWAKMIREHEAGSERMSRRGLLEADFYGLREWRPGDSRRWIHWRTSARRGSLIVRQFEQRRSQNLALLIDLWQPVNPTDDELAHVETAISFVATLIADACRKPGTRLMLDLAAREPLRHSGPATPLFLREQMDALALVEAHHEDAFPSSLGHALAVVPASTPTFVVSTRPIDWDALGQAAAERDAELAGRTLQGIHVGENELARYFQP